MIKFLLSKPIAVIMTFLGLLIMGLFAFNFIPVSLMPNLDVPEITIQIQADNMGARQVEDVLVDPMRKQLNQVSNVKDIKSESTNGLGLIKLSFTPNTRIDYAFIEVNEKIDRLVGALPRTIKRPKVIKTSVTDIPVFYLNMSMKNLSNNKKGLLNKFDKFQPVSQEFVAFSSFVDQVIKRRIEQLDQVAMVDVSGLVSSEILIVPNQIKMDALGIGLDDLETAIKDNNLELGNLLIKENQYQYNVRLGGTLKTVQDIEAIYINKHNRIFQLKELAKVLEQPEKRTGLALSNGKDAISMAILKQSDAKMNNLKTSLTKLLDALKTDYPEIDFSITRDQTKLLDYAINNLFSSLLIGLFLAVGIVFLFLKNIQSPLLIGITIPASILVCLLFFYLFHISINIISLSGLIIGIGLMIDNAIIVIDNISQCRERGYHLFQACVIGTHQVIRPLLSSVLSTCAVFLPLIFLSGISGALFYDQAMAISIGLFVSFFISISLLPVLYHLFHLKGSQYNGGLSKFLIKGKTIDYAVLYKKGFRWVMKNQKLSWSIYLLLLLLTICLFSLLPKNQMPLITSSETLLTIDWNEQINVEENKSRILTLLEPFQDQIINHSALVGVQQFLLVKSSRNKPSEATVFLESKTPSDLESVKLQLEESLKEKYPQITYKYSKVENVFNLIFSNKQAPLVAKLRPDKFLGTHKNETLEKLWFQLQDNIDNLRLDPIHFEHQLTLTANKEQLIIYNVSSTTLFNTLKSAFNERKITSISDNQNVIPVVLGGETKQINDVLNQTSIKSKDGTIFNIKNFIKVEHSQVLKTITGGKEGTYYPIEFQIENNELERTIEKINEVINNQLGFDVDFTGSLFTNDELIDELLVIFLISFLLLYLILASQFESLILPIIILLEIPISLSGAFLLLKIFGMSINLMSMIGIVLMCGIVINDSILKLDTIILLQRQGYTLIKALLVAGQRRLKPILMTSLTTIFGIFPLVFSRGLGAELQAPLGVALIGGMFLGTLVSLYFIPLCYYQLIKKQP